MLNYHEVSWWSWSSSQMGSHKSVWCPANPSMLAVCFAAPPSKMGNARESCKAVLEQPCRWSTCTGQAICGKKKSNICDLFRYLRRSILCLGRYLVKGWTSKENETSNFDRHLTAAQVERTSCMENDLRKWLSENIESTSCYLDFLLAHLHRLCSGMSEPFVSSTLSKSQTLFKLA